MKEEDKFRDITIISIVRCGGHGRINTSHMDESPKGSSRGENRERTDQRLVIRLVFQECVLLSKRQLPSTLQGLNT